VTVLPRWDPRNCAFGIYPTALNKPTIQLGSQNAHVGYLQGVLKCRSGQNINVAALPGPWYFGTQTRTAVRNFQAFWGLTVDGVVGPQTWAVIDWAARGFPT
jgi:peptidoglycan hydrolase-like protein with peptidoglycan-binding domain